MSSTTGFVWIELKEPPLKNIHKIFVVADKVLVKPTAANERTSSGLYLPPGVQEREKIQTGYVIKVGPGYAIGTNSDEEPWKENREAVRYIPLQAKEGDLAIFMRKDVYEIEYESENMLIIPHSAILMLIRDDFN
jgi:co-chaperonin GroES (HSP10)